MTVPGPSQISGKDALFEIRPDADAVTQKAIDGYLVAWYTDGYYEGRATLGRILGAQVIRAVGATAGARLVAVANSVLAAPEKNGKRARVGDELLRAMALTGDAAAVKYVLDIARTPRADDTLPGRALGALYEAFVKPSGPFEVVGPEALAANLDAVAAFARDGSQRPSVNNDAIRLLRVVGMPRCLPALLSLVGVGYRSYEFLYVAATNALGCGGADAIVPVVEAIPSAIPHEARQLARNVWGEIAKLPAEQARPPLTRLLGSASWVSRWVAVEALAAMKSKEDLEKIRSLSSDKARLNGYWGDQEDAAPADRKPVPTLGERVAELVKTWGA
jgi:hypothetical protein